MGQETNHREKTGMKRLLGIAMAAAVMVTASAVSWTADTTLRISLQLPLKSHLGQNLVLFKEEVETAAEGKVEVQIYDSAQLYKDKEVPQAVGSGAIEMGVASLTRFAGEPELYRRAGAWLGGGRSSGGAPPSSGRALPSSGGASPRIRCTRLRAPPKPSHRSRTLIRVTWPQSCRRSCSIGCAVKPISWATPPNTRWPRHLSRPACWRVNDRDARYRIATPWVMPSAR